MNADPSSEAPLGPPPSATSRRSPSLSRFLGEILERVEAERVCLYRFDTESGSLQGVLARDASGTVQSLTSTLLACPPGAVGFLQSVASGDRPYQIVQRGESAAPGEAPVSGARIAVPIRRDGQILGVVTADFAEDRGSGEPSVVDRLADAAASPPPALLRFRVDSPVERLGDFAASNTDGVGLIDAHGRLLYANDILIRLLGTDTAGLCGRSVGYLYQLLVGEADGVASTAARLNERRIARTALDGSVQVVRCRTLPLPPALGLDGQLLWVSEELLPDPDPQSERRIGEVLGRSHCILWSARVMRDPVTDSFNWALGVVDEAAAQAVVPLDVPPGQSFAHVWYHSRPASDRLGVDDFGRAQLRAGARRYTQEYSCIDRFGCEHWLREQATIVPIAADLWNVVGLCVDITEERAAVQALQATEARLGIALEAGGIAVWEYDGASNCVWTFHLDRLYGISPERLPVTMAESLALVHPDDQESLTSNFNRHVRERAPRYTLAYRVLDIWEQVRWMEAHGTIEYDDAGAVAAIRGVVVDLTERHRDAERLHQILEQFRAFMLHTPSAAFIKDSEGRYLFVNAEFERRARERGIDPIGLTDAEIYPPDLARAFLETDLRVLAGESVQATHQMPAPSGGRRWISVTKFPIPLDDGGRLIGGLSLDITRRHEAEEALRQTSALYGTLFDHAPIGIFQVAPDGRMMRANRRACEMLRASEADLLKLRARDVAHPEDADSTDAVFRRFYDGYTGIDVEDKRFLRRDGTWFWAQRYSTAIREGTGEIRYFITLIEDISARRAAEQDARRANRQLEDALEHLRETQERAIQQERLGALGQMASGVAHDFNNALAPIVGFAELLLQRPDNRSDDEKLQRYLTMIHRSALDAASVVSRLKEFYRPSQTTEVFGDADLNRIAEETVDLTRPKWHDQPLADGRIIDVRLDLAPDCHVRGVPADLREALTNLIFNAVDALPDGGTITLRTRVEATGHATLEVVDTGTGMTAETRRRCFEPFFSTKGPQGSGLGLSMIYGIVRRHSGEVEIDSHPGRGTRVLLRLPSTDEPALAETALPAPAPVEPLCILVADDEPLIRQMAADFLASEGHSVVTVEDGRDALLHLESQSFDLLLLDRAMPRLSGDRLAQLARQAGFSGGIILMTGYGELMRAQNEHPPGVDRILSKPFVLKELRDTIRALTEAKNRIP